MPRRHELAGEGMTGSRTSGLPFRHRTRNLDTLRPPIIGTDRLATEHALTLTA